MSRRMPGTSKRSDSQRVQYSTRIPSDLIGKVTGHPVVIDFPMMGTTPAKVVSASLSRTHARFSLGTADPVVAKQRAAIAIAYLGNLYDQLRNGPQRLSQKQAVALSRDVYDLVVTKFEENPGTTDQWAAFKVLNRAAREGRLGHLPRVTPSFSEADLIAAQQIEGGATTEAINSFPADAAIAIAALEKRFGSFVDWILATKALNIDIESRVSLLRAVEGAATKAGWRMKRAAAGDYSADPSAAHFPEWSPHTTTTNHPAAGVSWEDVITSWERAHEARGGSSAVRREWRSRVLHFAKFAKVEPNAVKDDHGRRWRDKRLADGLSAVTVGSSDLATLRAIFKHAIDERLLSVPNPFANVRVAGASKAGRKMRGFTDDEASKILSAAMRENDAYRRWVPWLCALTGSRVSTMMNLRRCDVKHIDGHHCIEVTAEAGPIKTADSQRTIPIHSALVDDGFLEFVATRTSSDRLFYEKSRRLRKGSKPHNPGKGRINSLRRWLHKIDGINIGREHGLDPNHGWRHFLKTKLRDAGAADTISDAITGHAAKTDGASYGTVSLKAMADALAKVHPPQLSKIMLAEAAE